MLAESGAGDDAGGELSRSADKCAINPTRQPSPLLPRCRSTTVDRCAPRRGRHHVLDWRADLNRYLRPPGITIGSGSPPGAVGPARRGRRAAQRRSVVVGHRPAGLNTTPQIPRDQARAPCVELIGQAPCKSVAPPWRGFI